MKINTVLDGHPTTRQFASPLTTKIGISPQMPGSSRMQWISGALLCLESTLHTVEEVIS